VTPKVTLMFAENSPLILAEARRKPESQKVEA